MEIKIERVTSWKRVVNAARFTVGKEPIDKEPSDGFKRSIVFAEHSPLRLLEFDVKCYNVPKYIIMHLVRHNQGIEKFVTTSRPDIYSGAVPRHEQRADDIVNCQFSLNAQAFINISKVRLCQHAETTTRSFWAMVIQELRQIEPILANACVPTCIYRGICPEISCGYESTSRYEIARVDYYRNFNHIP